MRVEEHITSSQELLATCFLGSLTLPQRATARTGSRHCRALLLVLRHWLGHRNLNTTQI